MSKFKFIQVLQQDQLAEIVLRHEPANIIDFEMMRELNAAIESVREAAFLKFSSALPHFSMGVDVKIHLPDQIERMLHDFHEVCRTIYNFEGITFARLNGFALGGGLELALVCDFILAHPETQLGFPEITLACFPPVASVLLRRKIGKRADRVLFTGEIIPASEASKMGLIDEQEILEKLQRHSPHALRTLKKALRSSAGFDFEEELKRAEQLYISELKDHPDTFEGINAFLQKRSPTFQRR